MLKKSLRLTEREVRRVIWKWKPFFSYWIVLNKLKNRKNYSRFAIVIWWKSTKTAVSRNFFRRRFYDFMREKTSEIEKWFDYVFIVKKNLKLFSKQSESIKAFDKDILFLLSKNK